VTRRRGRGLAARCRDEHRLADARKALDDDRPPFAARDRLGARADRAELLAALEKLAKLTSHARAHLCDSAVRPTLHVDQEIVRPLA
jgi:hypothetical protein